MQREKLGKRRTVLYNHNLDFKVLPFVFYPFHKFIEALLTPEVGEEEIVFHQKLIIDEPRFYTIFYPIDCFIFLIDE
jgi:hypothetical protein